MPVVLITATGAGSWTVPTGVTSIYAEVWAGGGSGQYGYAGGGGAYSAGYVTVTPGQTLSYFVAAPQTYQQSGTVAIIGQDSWVGSTSTIMAKGGGEYLGGAASAGFGSVKFSGGSATSGVPMASGSPSTSSRGGGASASPQGNGGNGLYDPSTGTGIGGTSPGAGTEGQSNTEGGGGGYYLRSPPTPGAPGGGGSGGPSTRGQVRITYDEPVAAPIVQVITATGAGSVTVPAGYNTVVAEVWSAGQAGWVEGGGHGGNYVRTAPTNVTPGSPISYNIGAAANPQQYSQPNAADSWVWSATTLLAKGGGHRSGNIGAVSYYGGLGDRTNYQQGGGGYPPGGGGGAAHPLGNGSNAVSYNGAASGTAGGASGSRAGGGYQNAGISNVEGGSGGGGGGTSGAGGAPGGGSGGHASGTAGAAGRGQIRFTFTYDASAEPVAPTRKPPRASTIQ